ncbi:alpha/beta hydrolase [Pseudonocardia nematodicida]|uniref:Alpha/beta hydrolase n=1 Tax=Pseudonocardia nematodicida TaxID=1206997 RepID=A0ABV1K507_9PSEU
MDRELAEAVALIPPLSFADLDRTRRLFDDLVVAVPADLSGVCVEDRLVPGPAGAPDVGVRILAPAEPAGAGPRPAVLDIHGGGFAIGSVALDDGANAAIVRATGAVVVSVEYRLAPEHPYPAGAEDCYAALTWLAAHAPELGADPARIALLGDSAGGGLAATTALYARDRGGPAPVLMALIEPELDDRLDTHSMRTGADTVVWNTAQAVHSWRYYLGGAPADGYAAPARMADLTGLPPTYLTVNELDCLRDEGLEFARRLLVAGVPTELHCWPRTFHGFAALVPEAAVSLRAATALHDALRRGFAGADELTGA